MCKITDSPVGLSQLERSYKTGVHTFGTTESIQRIRQNDMMVNLKS